MGAIEEPWCGVGPISQQASPELGARTPKSSTLRESRLFEPQHTVIGTRQGSRISAC